MGGMTRLLLLLWAGVTLTTALDLQKRIFNGSDCGATERLYHVKLLSDNGTHDSLCGGSLIHEQWILTAAHCYKPGWTMKAFLSVHPDQTKQKEVPVTVSDRKIYKEGIFKKRQHDIMLLKLRKPVSAITPIRLPDCTAKPKPKIDEVQIAGLGLLNETGAQRSATLRCAKLMVKDYGKFRNQHLLFGSTSQQDICGGDSGGGVVFKGKIYGVNSFSGRTECKEPAGFMDVCEYKAWIEGIIEPKGCLSCFKGR